MRELLKSWEKILRERVTLRQISASQAKLLYWIVDMTLRKMHEAGTMVEPRMRILADMLPKAFETMDWETEDSLLQELEELLMHADAIEPKFKAPTELSSCNTERVGKELLKDGSYFSIREPFDVSILKLGYDTREDHDEEINAFPSKGKTLLPRISESIFDKLPKLLKILILSRCPDKPSVYFNAARIYRTSNECILHFARTPGILDPNDYKHRYRRILFRDIIGSPAPVICYVCNYNTTIEDLRQRIGDSNPDVIKDSLSRHLIPFIERKGLEIVLAEIPKQIFNDNGNISVVSNKDILYSRRRQTRIEKAYRIRRGLMTKIAEKISFGFLPKLTPQEMFGWVESLPNFVSLSEISDKTDPRERANEIAGELINIAEIAT